jgi:galactokinase
VIQQFYYPGDLTDRDSLSQLLVDAGLGTADSQSKADLFAKAASQLAKIDTSAYAIRPVGLFVPGRIEVMGKHTDYAGGESIVAAAERGFCLVVSPRDDSRIVVSDVGFDETVEFNLDPQLVPQTGHWSNYPMTVARRVARNFPQARRGANIVLGSESAQETDTSTSVEPSERDPIQSPGISAVFRSSAVLSSSVAATVASAMARASLAASRTASYPPDPNATTP